MLRTGVSFELRGRIRTCAGSGAFAFAAGPAFGRNSLSESSFVPVAAVLGLFAELAAVCGLLLPLIISSKLFASESCTLY
jgi:hypothetical protein